MSRLVTLSDASTISDWPAWVWVVIAVAALVLGAGHLLVHRAPSRPAEPSTLDVADGAAPRCQMAHCGLAGPITRHATSDLGNEPLRVCPGHADEGRVKGWWVEDAPYDQEAAG